jgi:uncharacterized protein
VRVLGPDDSSILEDFLARHRDTSMFLRANARNAGLVYRGAPGEALYVANIDRGGISGVAAHCWNGMLLIQAPASAGDVARACVEWSGRDVTGLSGPLEQVREIRTALALDATPTALDGAESLYVLDLAQLVVPELLSSGAVVCRPPLPEERDTLCAWRLAYDIEILGGVDDAAHRQRSAAFLDAQIAAGNAWVALVDGRLVSLSAFNAALPDIVQLGGIYTPPASRGRGFAKAAVAASLLVARERGATRAVLFTNSDSAARSYEAVGFRRAGDYSLVLFKPA